jgi:hypothetical protein
MEDLRAMTKEEYLAIAETRYEAIAKLQQSDNFYDMEKKFVEIINDLGRDLLQQTLGEAGADRRKKKDA